MHRRVGAVAMVGAVLVAAPSRADAAPNDDYLSRLAATVRARLDALAAAHAPRLVPPTPVALRWRAVRLGSLDLGAPLVALTGADLDGDGTSELYAVTSNEVVAIAVRANRPVELGRVPFVGERAVPAPRDVVGTATVEGRELVAASSEWATDLRVALTGTTLTGTPGTAGFLVCPDQRRQLVPGRNYFIGTNESYGMRCRDHLVDREGHPLRVRATLAATGKLTVEVERCPSLAVAGSPAAGALACQPAGSHELADVGIAYELADLDRDGTPDVIVSGYVAPGDPDFVKVFALGDDKKPRYKKTFNGGVAGIAVLESARTAPIVIAAVRLAGATRVDLWRLN
jgi:hypothetical protein